MPRRYLNRVVSPCHVESDRVGSRLQFSVVAIHDATADCRPDPNIPTPTSQHQHPNTNIRAGMGDSRCRRRGSRGSGRNTFDARSAAGRDATLAVQRPGQGHRSSGLDPLVQSLQLSERGVEFLFEPDHGIPRSDDGKRMSVGGSGRVGAVTIVPKSSCTSKLR
jgi:hypothetical protein